MHFSPRQLQLISAHRRRLCDKEIADELGLTVGTVKVMNCLLFRKMNVRSRHDVMDRLRQIQTLTAGVEDRVPTPQGAD